MPAYLSNSDSFTVAEFLQTHYAAYYKIDVSNVHWGGEINTSHLFDIFCNFHLHKDSVKTRIDMISFVTSNYRRYSWDCDLFLCMNKLTLNDWVSKMSYWGNCGDALAIYVMSDMYGVHTCVVTKSKPWTTVVNTFQGTDIDVLKLCQVKLVYLGNHKYGKLVPKDFIGQSSYVTPSFNAASMIQPLPPPSLPTPPVPMLVHELEMANTLLDLHGTDSTKTSNVPVAPENTVAIIELPDDTDAMDKIVGYCEEPIVLGKHNALKSTDAMDCIVSTPSDQVNEVLNVLNVETITSDTGIEPVTAKQDNGLNVETTKLKACHVCVRPLENILFDETTTDPPVAMNDLPSGEHYTHSRTRKPVVRTSRIPRKASTGKQCDEPSDTPSPKKRRPVPVKPSASSPSKTRISTQKTKSLYPTRRLPPVPSHGEGDDTGDNLDECSLPASEITLAPKPYPTPTKKKGTFTTKSHALRKKYTSRKYICRMCPHRSDSARDLTKHHREKHGITYYSVYKKAFNNLISLRRHEYSHKEKKFQCSMCCESFNFNSELKTHLIQHQQCAKHLFAFPNCGKLFKNKSDLSRHTKEHTSKAIQCLDCVYSAKDQRNFESHRRKHSRIECYFCPYCDKGFIFNTQKHRHMAKSECQPAKN